MSFFLHASSLFLTLIIPLSLPFITQRLSIYPTRSLPPRSLPRCYQRFTIVTAPSLPDTHYSCAIGAPRSLLYARYQLFIYSALVRDRVLRQDLLFRSYPRYLLHVHYPTDVHYLNARYQSFITPTIVFRIPWARTRFIQTASCHHIRSSTFFTSHLRLHGHYTHNRSPGSLCKDLVQSRRLHATHLFINIRYTNIRLHRLWAKTSVRFGTLSSFQISISPRRPTFITLTFVRHTPRSF
jgi:hypothetical protein